MKKKKRLLTFFLLILGMPGLAIAVYAACAAGKSYIERYRNCFVYNDYDDTFQKIAVFTLNTVQGSVNTSTWGNGAGCLQAETMAENFVTRCSIRNSGTTRVSM